MEDRQHEELVGIIRSVLQENRTDYEKRGCDFDPAVWLGEYLTAKATRNGFTIERSVLDVLLAWDAISHPYIKNHDYREIVKSVIKTGAAIRGSNVVTLEQKAVKFLDVMAEAVGIPRTPGEATVDILKNIREKFHDFDNTVVFQSKSALQSHQK
jgi:hypothetical protein